MALSTSFTGGWFYSGQFFDHAVGGFRDAAKEFAKRGAQRTREDLLRSRGKFHLPARPSEVMAHVAEEMLDEDNDDALVYAFYEELKDLYIDWAPQYRAQIIAMRDRMRKSRADRLAAEHEAEHRSKAAERRDRSIWMERRRAAVRRAH